MNGTGSRGAFGLGMASKKAQQGQQPPPQQQQKSIIEIYTDWANHYLEKLRGKQKIKDLQSELMDGLVLADVIEAVTGTRVPDINRKPKNGQAMELNIQCSLKFLLQIGVSVADIHAKDVKEGNLKAILSLFFQLSRYKQQQKQQIQAQMQQQQASPLRNCSTPRIPSVPPSPCKSAIPSPARKLVPPASPSRSMLPAPKAGKTAAAAGVAKNCKAMPPTAPNIQARGQYQQYFPQKAPPQRGLGKRTSSSSGFSSGRSVSSVSESSVSLSSDTNFPSPSALKRINENVVGSQTSLHSKIQQQSSQRSMIPGSRPKMTGRLGANPVNGPGIPQGSRLGSASSIRNSGGSPNRSPKLARAAVAAGTTEMKDYGPIDPQIDHYPPHAFAQGPSTPSRNNGAISKLPKAAAGGQSGSRIPSFASSKIPMSPSRTSATAKPADYTPLATGCSVKPLQKTDKVQVPDEASKLAEDSLESANEVVATSGATTSENDDATALMTASFHSRTCSLPRQRRRGDDGSPGPANVAVVSPMPTTKHPKPNVRRSVSDSCSEMIDYSSVKTDRKKSEPEGAEQDPLQSIKPMEPLFNTGTQEVVALNTIVPQSGKIYARKFFHYFAKSL